jgi:hypothetical protein
MVLDLEDELVHPQERHGVTWRCIPHPSGRCRFYNEQTNRDLIGMMLEAMYITWRGEDEDDKGGERMSGAVPDDCLSGE